MKNPRIVFMGTPEFAVGILNRIMKEGLNVVGVITAPDRPAGRGRKLRSSAVKDAAEQFGIPILQPTNLKDPDFQRSLEQLQPDLQVVVAFRMLPRSVWELPGLGTFNLHASLLPDYRGAAPINWAIINRETQTGVTTFFIDDKIDTGAIIASRSLPIAKDETAGTLHDKLMDLGKELVIQTIHDISTGQAAATKQPEKGNLHSAPKLNPENTRIDWSANPIETDALVRGLCPYPAAWTTWVSEQDEKKLKVYAGEFKPAVHQAEVGSMITVDRTLGIAVPGGYYHIEELQLAGKRRMKIGDFLNGIQPGPDDYLK